MAAREAFGMAVYQGASADPDPRARLRALDRALTGAAGRPHLVLCPELFLSGYGAGSRLAGLAEGPDGPFAHEVAAIARRHGCAIAYGYPEAAGGRLFNAAAVIAGDGTVLANHRKTVLPTDYEKTWFRPGHGLTFLTLAGWRLALVICYEIEFPEIVRACAAGGAELVLAPTALTRDWGVVSHRVVPARAFENGIFLAYANHAGRDGDLDFLGESCIVGPDGADLARAGGGEALIEARLDPAAIARMRGRLPYLADSEGMGGLREAASRVPGPKSIPAETA